SIGGLEYQPVHAACKLDGRGARPRVETVGDCLASPGRPQPFRRLNCPPVGKANLTSRLELPIKRAFWNAQLSCALEVEAPRLLLLFDAVTDCEDAMVERPGGEQVPVGVVNDLRFGQTRLSQPERTCGELSQLQWVIDEKNL